MSGAREENTREENQWQNHCLYQVFATGTGKRGQGGLELCILKTWLDLSHPALVVFASHRILLVSLHTIVGHIQVVVAHALDSSYTKEQILEWQGQLEEVVQSNIYCFVFQKAS